MKYRIINRICGTQKEATNACSKFKGDIKPIKIKLNKSTGNWLIILHESDNKQVIEDARKYYHDNGINAFIQVVT